MKRVLHLFLGCALLLLFGCEYSPSGDFFKEIDQNPDVQVNINLNNYQDTIRLRGEVTFNYTYAIPGRTIYGYKLLFDNKVLREEESRNTSGAGSQHFFSPNFKDGYHLLQLVVTGNSGTGSMADKLGVEGVEVYRSWVVHIDNAPLQPVAITSVKPVDGRLQIGWQWPKRVGIRSLSVSRLTGAVTRFVASVSSPDISSCVDDEYVGGPVSYRIHLNTSTYATIDGPLTPYHYPLPHLVQATYNEQNQLTVKFTSTPFFRNFSKYHLSLVPGPDKTTTVYTDTVATFSDLAFGQDFDVRLATFQKKYENNPYETGLATESIIKGYGTSWGTHNLDVLYRRPGAGKFYEFGNTAFKVIDAATLQETGGRHITQQQPYVADKPQNAVSENGQQVYALISNSLQKLHPNTLQTIETYKLTDLLPHSSYTQFSLHGVSNTNRLLVAAKGLQQADSLFVVDMDNRKIVQKKWLSTFKRAAAITPNGKGLNAGDILFFEQSDGTWRRHVMPDGYYLYDMQFHPSAPLFFINSLKGYIFFSTETGAQVKTLVPEVPLSNFTIDAASGLFYGYAGNMLYIYNIDTGQLVRKLKVVSVGAAFVFKDRIFTNDRYIPL